MKAVIFAGGFGTRLSEETNNKPKPMVTVGSMPILWHIMKIYSFYGINDFIICLGYQGHSIKQFFADYALRCSDVTFDLENDRLHVHNHIKEPWRVTLVDTGLHTMTGGRLRRIRPYLDEETFCVTYGDGLSDVNIRDLVNFHKRCGKLFTMTVCKHTSRFGVLSLEGDLVDNFAEKPITEGSWMNSGFFVMEPRFLDYIESDQTVLEREPIHNAVKNRQIAAFKHLGFFRGMDSLRDRTELEALWNSNQAPWKKWSEFRQAAMEKAGVQ